MAFTSSGFKGNWLRAGLIFLCLVPKLASAENNIPRIRTRLDREQLALGEAATLTVELSWEGAASAFEFSPPDPPDVHLLEVVGSRQRSDTYRTGETLRQVLSFDFTLKGTEKGKGRAGYVQVRYRKPGEVEFATLRSEPRDITVTSAFSQLVRSLTKTILLSLLAGGAVAAAGVYIFWMVKRYRRRAERLIEEYIHALEDESIKELGKANKLRVEGNREGFYAVIWNVLSTYLERKFKLRVSEHGWEKRLMELDEKLLDGESRAELREILKILEAERFGISTRPDNELDLFLKRVAAFLEAKKSLAAKSQRPAEKKMNESSRARS